jgi:hypothetical protein
MNLSVRVTNVGSHVLHSSSNWPWHCYSSRQTETSYRCCLHFYTSVLAWPSFTWPSLQACMEGPIIWGSETLRMTDPWCAAAAMQRVLRRHLHCGFCLADSSHLMKLMRQLQNHRYRTAVNTWEGWLQLQWHGHCGDKYNRHARMLQSEFALPLAGCLRWCS